MTTIHYEKEINVKASYDVIVAGSGPAGICAAVAAPALIDMGITAIQAHMFVFYFACRLGGTLWRGRRQSDSWICRSCARNGGKRDNEG